MGKSNAATKGEASASSSEPPSTSTPKPTPKASALMERMADINRKNEETHKANSAKHGKLLYGIR